MLLQNLTSTIPMWLFYLFVVMACVGIFILLRRIQKTEDLKEKLRAQEHQIDVMAVSMELMTAYITAAVNELETVTNSLPREKDKEFPNEGIQAAAMVSYQLGLATGEKGKVFSQYGLNIKKIREKYS